jgi:hypothetical protein
LKNDPFVSFIHEPHLIHGLLYYRVVVDSLSLAIIVGKHLKTGLIISFNINNGKDYYLVNKTLIILQTLSNLPVLRNRTFAPSTVKPVKGLHKGGRLRFSLAPKLRATGFYLEKNKRNIIKWVEEVLTIVMMVELMSRAFNPLS